VTQSLKILENSRIFYIFIIRKFVELAWFCGANCIRAIAIFDEGSSVDARVVFEHWPLD